MTSDLRTRMRQHREGTFENAFTGRYNFDRLVWYEAAADRRSAALREKQIKAWRREKKVALIEATNPDWNDLSDRLDPWFTLRHD